MRVRGVTGWAAALVILVGLTTFGTSDFSQPRTTRAAIAPSGATSSVPINWSFSAAPQPAGEVTNHQFEDEGEEVGTPPTNHDFSSGLSGWTQTGTVSAEAGGPSGNYARLGNGNNGSGTVTSSSFTVDPATQAMSFWFQWIATNGVNYLFVDVLYGAGSTKRIFSDSCNPTNPGQDPLCHGNWQQFDFDVTQWRGQSIQLKFQGTRRVGVTDAGVMNIHLPGWTVENGLAYRETGNGGDGAYANIKKASTRLVSSPVQLEPDAQVVTYRTRWLDPLSQQHQVSFHVRTVGTTTWTQLHLRSCLSSQTPCPGAWITERVDITHWAGQQVEFRFVTTIATGPTAIDNIRVRTELPGWSVSERLATNDTPGKSGTFGDLNDGENFNDPAPGFTSSPFTVPADAEVLGFATKFFDDTDNWIEIFVQSGEEFGTSTEIYSEICECTQDWERKLASISQFAGQTIRLRLWSADHIGWDEIAGNFAEGALGGDAAVAWSQDPVNTTTGNYFHSHTDLFVPGRGVPLEFSRSYNSQASGGGDLGWGWTHNYAYELELSEDGSAYVSYPDGSAQLFTLEGASFVAPPGVFDELVENVDGSFTLTTREHMNYTFSAAGKLQTIADRNGNATTLTYDTNGFLDTVTDPGGRSLTFDVDTEGRITLVTDPLSRTVGFEYDANGDLVEATDVNGGTTVYTYDNHRLTSLQDSNGNTAVQQIYDEADRVVEQVDAAGGITCLYYGSGPTYTSTNCPGVSPAPVAGQTIIVDPRDNETLYDFDTSFRTVGITDHLGGITEFAYNAASQRICVTDPRGNRTRFEYDAAGNVTKIVDAAHTDASCGDAGADWAFTYTALNDVDLITDPLGRQTDFVYDTPGNLTEVISKDSGGSNVARTCYTRDSAGQATEVIVSTTLSDCTGNETLLEYDTRGNIVEITDPRFASAGTPVTTLAYDLGGRLLSVTNELGHVTEYTYDSRNAVLTVEDNLGNVTEYDYDAKGNLTNITDANLNTTTYVYDDADRLVEVIDALSQSTEYGYDGNDNLTAVENAKENTTTYAYDALNRLIEVSDPLSRETTYTYDAAGNLVTRTDARGLVTDYAYDSLNRLTNIDYSGSTTPDVNFTYDAVGNRLSMADGTGTTSYAYDALNRLTEVTFPGSRTVGYQYDNAGNRSRIVYPEGTRDVDYTYDQAGRMLTVTDWLSNVTQYTYNDAGYLTLTELPNGVTAEYGYDTADRLTSVANEGPGGVLSSFTYTLDDVGNRTQVVTPEGTESYTYDDLYRLTGVTYPDSTSESFSYDAVGNRTATAVLAYTYDDADQMLTAGSTSFDYDNNGNQVERGSDTLSYDHENRVVSGMFGSTSVSMAYDGDGLRQALTEGSQTNDFVWDVASGLPVILEDDSRAYVYGLDLISSVDGSNVETYYSHDGLGSVANLTNENGQTTVTYTFNAFGETKSSTGTADNAWQFTGEWKDATTDLYYLRARYLDPTSGRFLSEDYSSGLRGFPVSQHSYGYVANNPTNWVDPTGWRCDKPSGLFDVVDEAVDCGSDGLEKAGKAVGRTARGTWEVVSNSYYDGNITVATPLGGFTTGVVLDPDDGLFLYVGPAAGAGLDPWLVYASAGVSVGPNQDFDGESACGVQGALGPLQGQAGAAFDSKERATPYGEVGLGVGTPGAAGVCYRILPLGVW